MRTRFLLGPAGSGKTFRCLAEIREELKSAPEGLPLVLLAPKQATFQLERQLLAGADLPGYTRLQILSFERLAEFVLAEFSQSTVTVAEHRAGSLPSKKARQHADGQREFAFAELTAPCASGQKASGLGLPVRAMQESITGPQRILDEEGRVMVLRALLAQKQKELRIYRATARLPGFAQQLSLLLRELQRHQHSPEKLFALAAQLHPTPQLADKLHDLALLLRAYHDWLKVHRLHDVNSLLDLATEALRVLTARQDGLRNPPPNAKTTRHGQTSADHSPLRPAHALVSFGGLWLDGFAEMTPQELDFLALLTPLCTQATLVFCLEQEPAGELSWLSTWSVVSQTFRRSYQRLAALPGCDVQVEILERKPDRGRFAANPVLAHLEQHWPQPKPFGVGRSMERPNDRPSLQDSLRVAVCATADAEVVLAAREILRHVRAGGRFRDCAVLLRTHSGYHDALRRVFQRYEIPFFLDRREPVAHHPLAELTRYALRAVALGWEHDDWFGALKTGLVPGDEAEFDALENEALARGWKAGVWKQPLRIPDDQHLEKRLERLRERIVSPFELLAKGLAADNDTVQSQPTGSQLAEALRQCWAQLDVEETLDQWSASEPGHSPLLAPHAKIHSTVLSQMQSWLDNVAMAFPDDRLPLRDWLPILEAGLAGLTVGVIPPALDHVLVGTIDRSRNPELELALVLGLNESVFPAVPQMAGLLSETDREQLETRQVVLGPNKLAQLGHERYYGYVACTRARRRLVLTCAQRDANHRALNPSPFLAHVKRLFPSLEVQHCPEPEGWLASEHACELQAPLLRCEFAGSDPPVRSLSSLASLPAFASFRNQLCALASYAPADSFSPALAEQLFGPRLHASVSALEQFAACPFKFFVHFGLRAEERKYFETDAREQGSFQHTILARFHEELKQEGKRWRDLEPQEARARVGRIARHAIDEFREGLFDASDQNRFAARSLAGALENFIETIIGWMRAYGFDPRSVELAFGGEDDPLPAWEMELGDGHGLVIRGKIDRVDLAENPARDEALCTVIDYKSGAKKIDPLLLEHGIQIQLPAYLAALRHVANPRPVFGVGRLVPAGVFYVSLRGSYKAGDNRSAVLSGAPEARLLAYRHAGRFRFDALEQFDRQAPAGSSSGQFNYALTNEGKPNRRFADLLEPEEFNELLDHVESLLREMGRRILTGEAKVDPYRKGTEVACDFCDCRAICRIDRWTHPFRVLKREP